MSRFEFRSMLSYLVIAIMVFMIAITALFIYASVHLKDKITYRIVQQTELASELLTRASMDLMSAGHSGGKYSMILAYGNLIGIEDIGIFNMRGVEAFSDQSAQTKANTGESGRTIRPSERETFLKALSAGNSAGLFNREEKVYTSYVPLKAELSCMSCHRNNDEVLGVLRIRLSTGGDFELLSYMQNLIWRLWLIITLPMGALLVAGAVIREKNKLYHRLESTNSDLRNTYNKLNETRYYLQMILDNSKAIIITTDIKGRIVEFNKEAEALLEYGKSDVVGRDVLMLYDSSVHSGILEKQRVMDGDQWESRNREVILRSKSGRLIYVYLTLSTMVDEEGRLQGTVGVGKDISEQKMLQFKLLQSEKLAGIGTLASGIAHEINNPLAGILGMAEAIRDEDDMGLIKAYTRDIIQYSVNASSIVKELSSYSRSSHNMTTSTTDLGHVIENSIKMAKHSASFASTELEKEVAGGCFVIANEGELQQVFVNLVVNAIHAMDGKGRLTVRCWSEGNFVKAVVSDTGAGISKEHLNQIYDPFFTTKPVGKGTGLGLYVVYKIVTKFGGSIDVESRVGEGTVFTLKFPLAHPKSQEE